MAKGHNPSVTIRMYRQGLGDCFLVTFKEDGKDEYNMLIDCGLLQGTTNGKEIMRQVVEHIETTLTNNGKPARLDAVVLTHEHADHISGFSQAKDVFDRIEFGEVWAAWMDDETHPKYKLVRDRFHKQVTGLKAALAQMNSDQHQTLKLNVELLLNDFFEDDVLGAAGKKTGRSPAWDFALSKSTRRPRFCTPGSMFALPGFEDIRVYVLGPSEDFESFTQVNPPEEDTYRSGEGHAFALMDSFFAAVGGYADGPTEEAFQPFEERLRINPTDAETKQFFQTHYGFDKDAPDKWRRINDDWLSMVGNLALNLDTYTNNTCLALAIEFISSKKVLLFPGDAQFSNWLSWQKLKWEIPNDTGMKEEVTTKDLLERTVFYKVGHHGSHNATLKKHGLEMMKSDDLVAMISVDEVQARSKTSKSNPKGWQMPEEKLYERLLQRTRSRVVRADDDEDALKERCKDKNFVGSVKFLGSLNRSGALDAQSEPVCIELTIEG